MLPRPRRPLPVAGMLCALALTLAVAHPPALAATPSAPGRESIFGADVRGYFGLGDGVYGTLVAKAGGARLSFARYSDVVWKHIQPHAQSDWDVGAVAFYKRRVQALVAAGMRPIVGVHTTPDWALPPGQRGKGCHPPADLATFRTFMTRLVQAFAAQGDGIGPVPVAYWQIWNEPDTAAETAGGIGCFGNPAAADYGGGTYAAFLAQGAAGIRAADPSAKVVLGGLAFDCGTPDCHKRSFLDGVLAAGGAASFDVMDYHTYPVWSTARSDWDGGWSGLTFGNLRAARAILRAHGADKPVLLGETALVCSGCPRPQPAGYQPDQANYVLRLYTRALSSGSGLVGADWYTLGAGDFNSDLLNPDLSDAPGYLAMRATARALDGVLDGGRLAADDLNGAATYRFCRGLTEVRVAWTNTAGTPAVPLPPGATVRDKLGNLVAATAAGFEPLVAERTLTAPCQRRAYWNYGGATLEGSSANGSDLTTVPRYTRPGGPCAGAQPGTCTFDTRTMAGDLESITAGDHYWNYRGDTLASSGTLSGVTRYHRPGGPCPSACSFDTRTMAGTLESITAGDHYWNYRGDTLASSGTLSGVTRYGRPAGPCAGKQPGTCTFDTRTMAGTLESITAGDHYWNYQGDALVSSGTLGSVGRWGQGGPCSGRAAGTCRFGTRMVTTQRDGTLLESITD